MSGIETEVSGASEAPDAPSRGGRRRHKLWAHFERTGSANHPQAICVHGCKKMFAVRDVNALVTHAQSCTLLAENHPAAKEAAHKAVKEKEAARKAAAEEASASGPRLPKRQRPSTITEHFGVKFIGNALKDRLDVALLLAFVMGGIPFSFVANPFFVAFIALLCPSYELPGRNKLSEQLLADQGSLIKALAKDTIEDSGRATITIDGWSNPRMQSIYGYMAVLPDRRTLYLHSEDLSADSHTGNFLADRFAAQIEEVNPKNVIALVTDNASNCKLAREQVCSRPGFGHIIPLRCYMHAFSLVMGSILGHDWAANIISNAQRLVTLFRASHKPYQILKEKGKAFLQVPSVSLQSSNTTRFTSVYECLYSVHRLETPLKQMGNEPSSLPKQSSRSKGRPALAIIQDRDFWAGLETLVQLMRPFALVTMAIQARQALLADVFRYWIFLGTKLVALEDKMPWSFTNHCRTAFGKRYLDICGPICHLALLLHPGYCRPLLDSNLVDCSVWATALEKGGQILQSLGKGSWERLKQFGQAAGAYMRKEEPFNRPLGAGEDPKRWWRLIIINDTDKLFKDLAEVALLLLDIVPHSADTERLFSLMGWYHNKLRNRLLSTKVGHMAAIRIFHSSRPDRARPVKQLVLPGQQPSEEVTAVEETAAASLSAAAAEEPASAPALPAVGAASDDLIDEEGMAEVGAALVAALADFKEEEEDVQLNLTEVELDDVFATAMKDFDFSDPSIQMCFNPEAEAPAAAPAAAVTDELYTGAPVDVAAALRAGGVR